jgi:hypothetical protein
MQMLLLKLNAASCLISPVTTSYHYLALFSHVIEACASHPSHITGENRLVQDLEVTNTGG